MAIHKNMCRHVIHGCGRKKFLAHELKQCSKEKNVHRKTFEDGLNMHPSSWKLYWKRSAEMSSRLLLRSAQGMGRATSS